MQWFFYFFHSAYLLNSKFCVKVLNKISLVCATVEMSGLSFLKKCSSLVFPPLVTLSIIPIIKIKVLLILLQRSQITSLFGAEKLWSQGYTGAKVKMAIFDTGIRANHPHFRNIKVQQLSGEEWEFILVTGALVAARLFEKQLILCNTVFNGAPLRLPYATPNGGGLARVTGLCYIDRFFILVWLVTGLTLLLT